MDKIIKISLSLFIVILIAFTSVIAYQVSDRNCLPELVIQHVFLQIYHHYGFKPLQCDVFYSGTSKSQGLFPYCGGIQRTYYYRNS